jgi:hypothetical protein
MSTALTAVINPGKSDQFPPDEKEGRKITWSPNAAAATLGNVVRLVYRMSCSLDAV